MKNGEHSFLLFSSASASISYSFQFNFYAQSRALGRERWIDIKRMFYFRKKGKRIKKYGERDDAQRQSLNPPCLLYLSFIFFRVRRKIIEKEPVEKQGWWQRVGVCDTKMSLESYFLQIKLFSFSVLQSPGRTAHIQDAIHVSMCRNGDKSHGKSMKYQSVMKQTCLFVLSSK